MSPILAYMAPTPRPQGWQGGSEDFGFVNTLNGHVSSRYNRAGAPITPDEARNCTDDVEDLVHMYDAGSDETGSADYGDV